MATATATSKATATSTGRLCIKARLCLRNRGSIISLAFASLFDSSLVDLQSQQHVQLHLLFLECLQHSQLHHSQIILFLDCLQHSQLHHSLVLKEVARVLGMEDTGLDYNEYEKECDKYCKAFPGFIADLQTEVPNVSPSLQIADIVTILKGMSVASEERKTQFKQLMTYYLIERFLKCPRNPQKARRETWRLIVDLKKCWSVNWPQAKAEHLHDAMKSCREWWDKGRRTQHSFTGCAPVLEAVSFERIQKIRPKILDHLMPIEKYEAKRGDLGDSLLCLVTEDEIDLCPDCCTVTTKMKGLSLSNAKDSETEQSESDEADSAANTLETEDEAEPRSQPVEVAVVVDVVATEVQPRRSQREKRRMEGLLFFLPTLLSSSFSWDSTHGLVSDLR
ncbi:hypothetical protein Tco_0380855 [Tanacetum coccineum]